MKHGTVRVVHYDEISAGGSVSGRETDPSALSCPYTGTDDGHEREILWQSRIAERQQEIWRCAIYLRLSREDEGTAMRVTASESACTVDGLYCGKTGALFYRRMG